MHSECKKRIVRVLELTANSRINTLQREIPGKCLLTSFNISMCYFTEMPCFKWNF